MIKKKIFFGFLISFLILLFVHFISVFKFQKNETLTISNAIEVCSSKGIECESENNFTGLKNYDLNKKIDVKIIKHKKEFILLQSILIFFMIIFFAFLIKDRLFDNNKDSISLKSLFLFSLSANYRNFYLISNNVSDISLFYSFIIVVIFCIIYFIFYYIFKIFLKKQILSAYFALIFTFLFSCINENSQLFCLNDCLLIAACGLFVIFLLIYFSIKNLKFLKTFTIVLLALCALNSISKYQLAIKTSAKKQDPRVLSYIPRMNLDRDIYILLFDMYSGDEILKSMGFDNVDFISYLKNKKFMVFENISSNYTKTRTSVPSFLNLDYAENINHYFPSDALSSSLLFQIARKNNYKIYYFNSCPEFVIKKEFIDYIYNSTFEIKKLNTFNLLVAGSIFNFTAGYFNELNLIKALDKFLDRLVFQNKQKKLIFAHFMMPHFPYVYDENGKKIEEKSDILQDNYLEILNQKSYISYLKYTNKNIEKIINKIFEKSPKEPIIIIMGDHGVRMKHYLACDEEHIDELLEDKINLESYFNTFLAYYNPDMNKNLYKNSTLIGFYRNFVYDVFDFKTEKIEEKRFYNIYSFGIHDLKTAKGFYIKK